MATPKIPRKRAAKTVRDKAETPPVDVTQTDGAEVDAGQEPADAVESLVADAPLISEEPADSEVLVEPEIQVEDAQAVEAHIDDSAVEQAPDAQPSPFSSDAPDSTAEEAVALEEPKVEVEAAEPEEKPEPKTEMPRHDAAAPTVVKSGPGFVPLVLGGVIAAGLGFGLAQVVPGISPLQTQVTQQAEDIKALRAELQALPKDDSKAVLDELSAVRETAASALEAAQAAASAPPEVAPSADLTALQDRVTALETRPAAGGSVDPAIISKLTAEIDTLRSGLADQKTAAEKLVAEAEAVRADAAAKAQSVLLKAALTNVVAAMQNGASFAEPLTELTNAGLTIPAALSENAENGVPTVAALMASFDEPARAALETSLRGNMGSTWTDRVASFLKAQTGARSLTPQEGSDPDAILSRANAAVATGDIQTALTEIATLPDDAQAALAAWVAQAKLRFDAQAATVELATALSER